MGRTLAFLATNRASGRTLIWRRGPSARTTRIDHKVGPLHRRFCLTAAAKVDHAISMSAAARETIAIPGQRRALGAVRHGWPWLV